jgi:hypothetical protein
MSLINRAMKNKTIGVTLLDTPTSNKTSEPVSEQDAYAGVEIAAAYVELAKDLVTHTALTIGGVYAACKIVEKICR